jgi:hypothetical protein
VPENFPSRFIYNRGCQISLFRKSQTSRAYIINAKNKNTKAIKKIFRMSLSECSEKIVVTNTTMTYKTTNIPHPTRARTHRHTALA